MKSNACKQVFVNSISDELISFSLLCRLQKILKLPGQKNLKRDIFQVSTKNTLISSTHNALTESKWHCWF